MEIKKYDTLSKNIGNVTRSQNESMLLSANYSDDTTYTIAEFVKMLENDTWKGGNVEGMGYVSANEFVKASEDSEYGSDMIKFIHGSSINGDNLEDYLASVFSFMNPPYDNQDPNMGHEGDGNSGNTGTGGNNNNKKNESQTSMSCSEREFVFGDMKIRVVTCVMFDCAMFYFYLTCKGGAVSGTKITCKVVDKKTLKDNVRNIFEETNTGYVNYENRMIGTCAIHLNNGHVDCEVQMIVKNGIGRDTVWYLI